MFERRLRLFLVIVFLGAMLLAARAAQVQVVDGDDWLAVANSSSEKVTYLDAPRGDLLDVRGRVIARDVPTFEACVNYRALPLSPDAKWLRDEARRRARKIETWAAADEDARERMIAQESQGIVNDLEDMWNLLATLSGQTRAELDAVRLEIVKSVQRKREKYWEREYEKAHKEFTNAPPAAWYERWIAGQRVEPKASDFVSKQIGDEFVFHPLLPDVRQEVFNQLKMAQDRFPQYTPDGGKTYKSVLDLRPAVRRDYPYGDVAAHTIGYVRAVNAEDREADPNREDDRRRYALIDRIGGDGLEALMEQPLRGTRGEKRASRRGPEVSIRESSKGESVRTSIDIELSQAVQEAFKTVTFHTPDVNGVKIPDEQLSMNGAAIVIDIKTGQVLTLVSVPSFDLNQFDRLYQSMVNDELNRPLTNRALMDAIEPGSTVKPIVGLAAVTQKLLKASDTIECDGYAHINGRRLETPRCWTMSMFKIAHHQTAGGPHPTGHLTLADAIERSCNVYFVTEGAKLGLDGLSYWMRKFGFGQATGIGLPEAHGLVPMKAINRIPMDERASAAWYASIGQGYVLATPLQVANEMATIARDGIWMRPTLLTSGTLPPTTQPDGTVIPERIDLKLDPEAIRAVKHGMKEVVNSDAGTGKQVRRDDVLVAGKTGSATASPLSPYVRDDLGRYQLDTQGNRIRETLPYGTHEKPNTKLPWYRLSGYDPNGRPRGTHSWVGGFAPADNPQIAFAVYVEYGGSGGIGAGSVVRTLMEKCVELGYVRTTDARPAKPNNAAELIIDD